MVNHTENSNHDTNTNIPPPSPGALKRSFSTVEPPRPTAAKRRVANFVDGYYERDLRSGSAKLRGLVSKVNKAYSYDDCPLHEGHIRLLFLRPSGNPDDDIFIELRTYPIEDLVRHSKKYQFTALSYNWGEGAETNVVFVDREATSDSASNQKVSDVAFAFKRRMRMFTVRPNLYAFLKQFRHPTQLVALWIDRVCINQASNLEKQDQVSRMGRIYSTATNVSIWLGPADQEGKTDRAMDFVSMILEGPEEKLHDQYAMNWSDLLLLMRRRWFSRRWIIQELALSKNAEVRCGSKRVHWRDFSDAVSIFALHFDEILKIIKRRPDLDKSLEGIKDMQPFGARILVDVLSNTFQRHVDGSIYTPRQGLESLISSLSTFETSDPRDTVYTLLNLCKEAFELPSQGYRNENRRHRENQPPVPDYTLDLLEVYTYFLKWCVKESRSLDILCRHWASRKLRRSWTTSIQGL